MPANNIRIFRDADNNLRVIISTQLDGAETLSDRIEFICSEKHKKLYFTQFETDSGEARVPYFQRLVSVYLKMHALLNSRAKMPLPTNGINLPPSQELEVHNPLYVFLGIDTFHCYDPEPCEGVRHSHFHLQYDAPDPIKTMHDIVQLLNIYQNKVLGNHDTLTFFLGAQCFLEQECLTDPELNEEDILKKTKEASSEARALLNKKLIGCSSDEFQAAYRGFLMAEFATIKKVDCRKNLKSAATWCQLFTRTAVVAAAAAAIAVSTISLSATQ